MALFGKKKTEEKVDAARAAAMQKADAARAAATQNAEAMRAAALRDPQAARAAAMERAAQVREQMGKMDLGKMRDLASQFAGATTGSGGGGWIDAVLHPQSDFIRVSTCEACGGQKRRASPTAYVYCDYCGALADYDFRALIRASGAIADPAAYAAVMNQVGAQSREARAAGDRERYRQLRHQFYDAWLTATPAAASHRIGDPAYRAAYIDYMVAGAMATDFDPGYQASEEKIKQAVLGLRHAGMQVEPDSFWPLLEIYLEQVTLAAALTKAAGVGEMDPDRASDAVRRRIATSAMVQGWMTSLSAEAGEELVARTGLQGEYQRVEPVADGATRHCGSCGSEFAALAGATTAVCDHCGHKLDVGSAEWPCGTCGGLMTMPAGATETTCPFCRGMVSRVGR